jgi:hypothetical protein
LLNIKNKKINNMKKILSILLVSCMVLSVASCRKDKEATDEDVEITSQNSLADASMEDLQTISDQGSTGNLTSYRMSEDEGLMVNACAVITHDSLSSPRMLTIDFGATNCLCNDGRYRRGKLTCTYTGTYRAVGSTRTIITDNYFVNDNKIAGTRTVTNTGLNTAGNYQFDISDVVNVTFASGSTLSRNSTRVRKWVAGYSTMLHSDDVYLITGSATGTNAAGNSYSATITTPLRREMNCRWIVSGVLQVMPSGKAMRSINFGSGSCDNQATATVGSFTKAITLN